MTEVVDRASGGLVGRRSLVELIVLAAVAGEHVLVIGPPGTAKSQAVRQVAATLGESYFEYLLGRFTEPSELFGPIDLRELREGRVVVDTTDMLPEAEIAFLDEVFLGSSAILNTLLGMLNERVFRRGHTVRRVPLRMCVGASNELPTDTDLAAFADRFLVRVFIDPITDPELDQLLASGWKASVAEPQRSDDVVGLLDQATALVNEVDLDGLRPEIAQCIRLLRRHEIGFTDRRSVRAQRLIAAAAVLDGRLVADPSDLWALIPAIPTAADQERARDILSERIEHSSNLVAIAAAEEISAGLLAIAHRLARAFDEYQRLPAGDDRSLRMEGLAREIDATFPPEALPTELVEIRAAIVDEV